MALLRRRARPRRLRRVHAVVSRRRMRSNCRGASAHWHVLGFSSLRRCRAARDDGGGSRRRLGARLRRDGSAQARRGRVVDRFWASVRGGVVVRRRRVEGGGEVSADTRRPFEEGLLCACACAERRTRGGEGVG